jgi:hypothetical protein
VKITDFGLWFYQFGIWSLTIPKEGPFKFSYDGVELGCQHRNFCLYLYPREQYIVKLKNKFPEHEQINNAYLLGRLITLEDFEVIKNPCYSNH